MNHCHERCHRIAQKQRLSDGIFRAYAMLSCTLSPNSNSLRIASWCSRLHRYGFLNEAAAIALMTRALKHMSGVRS